MKSQMDHADDADDTSMSETSMKHATLLTDQQWSTWWTCQHEGYWDQSSFLSKI